MRSVLHHLTGREILDAPKEFDRILEPDGALLVLEPCLAPGWGFMNWIMQRLDEGRFIRSEDRYEALLARLVEPRVLKRSRLPYLYSMLFLSASRPKRPAPRSGAPSGRTTGKRRRRLTP